MTLEFSNRRLRSPEVYWSPVPPSVTLLLCYVVSGKSVSFLLDLRATYSVLTDIQDAPGILFLSMMMGRIPSHPNPV